jgi:CBS domain-containing protein
MAAHQVRRLPVVEAGKLVGMLSLNDLARAAAKRGNKKKPVTPAEIGKTLAAICRSPQLKEAASSAA